MVSGPPETDPTEWPDHTLVTRGQLRMYFGNGAHRIINSPDFPPPALRDPDRRYMPVWQLKEVRAWERTHCIYGTGPTRCTHQRAEHGQQLGLCAEHLHQARAILRRKDPE